MDTRKAWIVWNPARNEGFVTTDYDDAHQCSTGNFSNFSSSVGTDFHESYAEDSDEPLVIEEVDLP